MLESWNEAYLNVYRHPEVGTFEGRWHPTREACNEASRLELERERETRLLGVWRVRAK